MSKLIRSIKSISIFPVVLWILFLGVLGYSVYYSIFLSGSSFADGTVGNLLATLVGVVLAVPVAISIDRIRQKKETEAEQKAAELKRSQVLTLLLHELQINQLLIEKRLGLEDNKYPHPEFRSIAWDAFSSGGELKWIDDVTLLSIIANAYHTIRQIISDEESWYHAELERDPRTMGSTKGDRIRSHIVPIYPQAKEVIEQSIRAVEQFLRENHDTSIVFKKVENSQEDDSEEFGPV